ncbi:hypothetical protein HK096_009062, partial [Nowakowskiella sp. JEL0078]
MSGEQKIGVMFVCLGNICRSPMAEAVFRQTVLERGIQSHFNIDSSGTAGYHVGDFPDPRTVSTCRSHGVPVSHNAQKLNRSHFEEFEWILTMDQSNLEEAKRAKPNSSKANIKLFGDFDPLGETIISDPYYG